MKIICVVFCINLFGIPQVVAHQHVENQIVEQIDLKLEQSLSQLEEVVNINSGTLNIEGVKKVGDVFRGYFDGIGFDTEWIDGSEFNRAGHLVSSHGDKGLKILMIGHLDTVFAKSDDFQTFQKQDQRFIAGPGITDMKGGNIIILTALDALKQLNLLDNVSIRVVLTGDEESSGRPLSLSKKAIVDGAKWADIALGFEDGDSNIKTAVIARRSSVNWQLDVTGKPAHSSQIFSEEVGYGAVFEAARILNAFREKLAGVGDITFNPGLIVGGTETTIDQSNAKGEAYGKNNVVAKTVMVKGGIRTLTHAEFDHTKQMMQAIVKQNLPQTSATLVIGEGYPPMAPTDGNRALLALYSDVSESLGYGPVIAVNPRNAGAADISFAADHVEMALDGLGLMGSGGHTKDEVADISSFSKNIHKAAILIYRLSQRPAD
jgi:glutamate carboxypeptidase